MAGNGRHPSGNKGVNFAQIAATSRFNKTGSKEALDRLVDNTAGPRAGPERQYEEKRRNIRENFIYEYEKRGRKYTGDVEAEPVQITPKEDSVKRSRRLAKQSLLGATDTMGSA